MGGKRGAWSPSAANLSAGGTSARPQARATVCRRLHAVLGRGRQKAEQGRAQQLRSGGHPLVRAVLAGVPRCSRRANEDLLPPVRDRKSTRLNSSHGSISYAVFCLKK